VHPARMKETRNTYTTLVRRPQWKRLYERPRRRWDDNIKIGHREIGCDDADCIHLAQDRNLWRGLVNTVTGSIKGGEFID
jgi:hypothetical protein